MARHERVLPQRRQRIPHLLHQQPRRRGDGGHLELSRHHAARAPGGVGELARGLPPDPDLQVVELARQLRRRRSARQEVGRGVGRRRGGVPGAASEHEAMSQACSGGSDGSAIRRTAVLRATDGLALAASPTFAIMALLTGVLGGGPAEMLCAAAHVSPLSGMVTMYLLMSAFHVAPWLKLIRADARWSV